jgi:hypothetical protein
MQYQALIRRLTHVKQTGSVQDYIENLNTLMHQMLAHNLYYFSFVDGLKSEIRRVVLIQRPANLDTAGSLALRDRNEMTAALAEYRSISVLDKSRL